MYSHQCLTGAATSTLNRMAPVGHRAEMLCGSSLLHEADFGAHMADDADREHLQSQTDGALVRGSCSVPP